MKPPGEGRRPGTDPRGKPYKSPAANPYARAHPTSGPVPPVARRILLVEDEPDIRRSLADLLGTLPDASVEQAVNFQEGRAKLGREAWAAIVSDERLGDGRGVDLLTEASRGSPTTVLVLMSAFQDFDAMMRGVNVAHIDHFFQKPVDPDDLLRWLERALQDKTAGKADPGRARPFRRIGSPDARPTTSDVRRL
jgi:DNA-binding NtrC family response regulator